VNQSPSSENDLAPEIVLPLLRTQRLGRAYEFFSACASTNDVVRSRAAAGAAEGLLVVADSQSAGRGRLGRAWHSPPGQNLYLSLLLRPALPARHATPLTLLAGASLARTLANAGAAPRLRWPNDLLLPAAGEFRKAAGILTEMATSGEEVRHVVVGIGLNVNQTEFPPDIEKTATSLALHRKSPVDRTAVFDTIVGSLDKWYAVLQRGEYDEMLLRWKHSCEMLGREITLHRDGTLLHGMAFDIAADGALIIHTSSGTETVYAGDVSLHA